MQKVLILVASRKENVKLANAILKACGNERLDSEIINLVELELPLYSDLQEEKEGIPSKAQSLKSKVLEANSLIFVAPEYNGGVPPCLNNAIAWVSRSGKDWREAFNGKRALIATHSGGGGFHVLSAMRHQLSYLGMNVLGRQILTHYSKQLNPESLESCILQLK